MSELAARGLWETIKRREWERLPDFFTESASIEWANSGERFQVTEFVRANREYPGQWDVALERIETMGTLVVTVALVWNESGAFRAVSFFEFEGEKIVRLSEYWGDVTSPPDWRRDWKLDERVETE